LKINELGLFVKCVLLIFTGKDYTLWTKGILGRIQKRQDSFVVNQLVPDSSSKKHELEEWKQKNPSRIFRKGFSNQWRSLFFNKLSYRYSICLLVVKI